ncbi:MAG: purine-nucleoside phosphorylase [Kineosporiaceae bacterium]|nr:purine-nucleoside phosphorylase [Kineosporiaceae bacterium]
MAPTFVRAGAAAAALAERTGVARHDAVVVLGSGWSGAGQALGELHAELETASLPGFFAPAAEGHLGVVRSCLLDGVRVLVFCGRTHLYEGHGPDAVAHTVRTAAAAGCRLAVLTSANGSLRPQWPTGTGVLVRDHLNLTGCSPLVGPRFVDLTDAYSPGWRARARALDPDLVEGVYAMLPGPHYQTVAETLALRTLGADVVGMSTALETIAAREAGLDVLALSVVTTVEASGDPIDPEEVIRVAAASATRLGRVIAALVAQLAADPGGSA